MSKYIPNSYQTPNVIMDEIQPLLTPTEFVTLSFAIRRILGWYNKIESRKARISLSQFEKTGLSLPTIRKALKGLGQAGLLIKTGKVNNDGQEYQLYFDETSVDFDWLNNRGGKKSLPPENGKGGKSSLPPRGKDFLPPSAKGGKKSLPNKHKYLNKEETQEKTPTRPASISAKNWTPQVIKYQEYNIQAKNGLHNIDLSDYQAGLISKIKDFEVWESTLQKWLGNQYQFKNVTTIISAYQESVHKNQKEQDPEPEFLGDDAWRKEIGYEG